MAAEPGPFLAVSSPPELVSLARRLGQAWRLRQRRRLLLWRAFRKRRELTCLQDRTADHREGAVLCFSVMRNEHLRLPWFLNYYRTLGVSHFLIVDNGSTDGTAECLAGQPDVSLWSTGASYKAARFGMDWLMWLLMRYGHGSWCLTVDADELLTYPNCDSQSLSALTDSLEARGCLAMGALMLDMYPKGHLDDEIYESRSNPIDILSFFDAYGYTVRRQDPMRNLWIQGGPRARAFFADMPRRAPTLNKLPLVKWNRRFAYVNATHALLPRRLNLQYDPLNPERPSGVLLHTKFLHTVAERSREEKLRREHFGDPAHFDAYYDSLAQSPVLWTPESRRFSGWLQLVELGLMSPGASTGRLPAPRKSL